MRTNPIYLMFQSNNEELKERGYIEADQLVEIGTPITESGEDMEYVGWTTNYNDAIKWIQFEIDN